MVRRLITIATLAFGLAASLALATATGAAADAQIRVIHASPDTPPVDVYIDGAKAIPALGFTKASDYRAIAAGTHDLQFFAPGATPTSSDPLLQARGVDIPAGAKLSFVAIGFFAAIHTLVVDDRTTVPASGKAKVRFVHVGPDVLPLDLAVKGGSVLVANAQFGAASPYQELAARSSDLELRPAGTPTGVVGVAFAPDAGKAYSVYLMSLGATKVFLDTTASDAEAVAAPTTSAPQAAPSSPDGAVATQVVLAQTGRPGWQAPVGAGQLLIGLAAAFGIGGGTILRRRASP